MTVKLADHFDTFLKEVVNLNATRLQLLDDSAEALQDFLRESTWSPRIRRFVPQGSWAHGTIIKPVEGKEFDADLLVLVDPVENWSAAQYVSSLKTAFLNSGTYKDKVSRSSHCVTIAYAGERRIDIAPCVVDREWLPSFEVCNSTKDSFERSEPESYTAWLRERNAWTGGNGLKKATRLIKYLRDIKTRFSCSSILLTTILGMRISFFDSFDDERFADVPTSLKTIMSRLDDWLQANPTRPLVPNPVLQTECLGNLWTDTQYAAFRNAIHQYRAWIDEAYDEPDRDESIAKWRRVFGDKFAADAVLKKATSVSSDAIALAESNALMPRGWRGDLVTLFLHHGRRALPSYFDRLPHKKQPRWPRAQGAPLQVAVVGSLYTRRRDEASLKTVESGQGPLPKHHAMRFDPRTRTGMPLAGGDYKVYWRVTNTDREAGAANALRGGFEDSNDGLSRWEDLLYRGVHSVEAFIVRKRDNRLIGQSKPFYVVID